MCSTLVWHILESNFYTLYFLFMYLALSLWGTSSYSTNPTGLRLYIFHPLMSKDLRAAYTSNLRRCQFWIVHQKIHLLKKQFFKGACALKRNNTLSFYGKNIVVSSRCAKHDRTSFKVYGREEYNSYPGKLGGGQTSCMNQSRYINKKN